jgi:RecA-family ATPase
VRLETPEGAEIERLAALERAGSARNWDANDVLQDYGPEAISDVAQAAEPQLLPLADLEAWSTSHPSPKPFVWAGRVPKREVTKVDGAGGSNKSTAMQQLVTCRAAGLPFLGVELEPGISLYLSAEDDFDRLEWMHEHICRAIGVDRRRLVGKLHLSSVRGYLNNELATFEFDGRIKPTAAFTRLKATLAATGADLVALDNVAHLFAGNESDRGQVTAFINLLYSLGVTVLLIGHPNKAGDSYSGSTAWLNAIRSQLVVERADELDPDARTLTVGKANYARQGEPLRYRWHDFALWLEDDLPPDTRAELEQTVRASGDNELFLRCLRLRNEQKRPVSESPSSRTYAPRVFAEMAESKKIGAARLEAAMDRLFRIKCIERGFVGRIDRKDKEGLRECAEVRAEGALTGRADVRRQGAPSALSHTPSTTYYPGAAHTAAAPDDER